MMVVDTSALMAIVLNEVDRDVFFDVLSARRDGVMSAGTIVEAAAVYVTAFPNDGVTRLHADLSRLGIQIVDFTAEQGRLASQARFQFGKGRGGRLNFGDCFAYALAKSLDAPLLFKGDDFVHTDVKRVM